MVSVFVVLVVSQPVFVPDDINVALEDLYTALNEKQDILLMADELQTSPPTENEVSVFTLSVEPVQPEIVGRITEQVFKTSSGIPQLTYKESKRELSFYTNFTI